MIKTFIVKYFYLQGSLMLTFKAKTFMFKVDKYGINIVYLCKTILWKM